MRDGRARAVGVLDEVDARAVRPTVADELRQAKGARESEQRGERVSMRLTVAIGRRPAYGHRQMRAQACSRWSRQPVHTRCNVNV